MLAAALDVVTERGLAATTVELVCDRAGYTRGAFYSNFSTMDELLVALFEERATDVLGRLRERFDQVPATASPGDLSAVVAHVLGALPVDRQWYLVSAELTAQALRRPAAAEVLRGYRDRLVEQLAAMLEPALRRVRRVPRGPVAELTRAVLAMHDGVVNQALVSDDARLPDQRLRFVTAVLLALTEPDPHPATRGPASPHPASPGLAGPDHDAGTAR